MSLDLDAIKARLDRATAGPWQCDTSRNHQGDDANPDLVVAPALDFGNVCELHGPESRTMPDMAFIANARQDVDDLIAEVERLRAKQADVERIVDSVNQLYPVSQASLHDALRDLVRVLSRTEDGTQPRSYYDVVRSMTADPDVLAAVDKAEAEDGTDG